MASSPIPERPELRPPLAQEVDNHPARKKEREAGDSCLKDQAITIQSLSPEVEAMAKMDKEIPAEQRKEQKKIGGHRMPGLLGQPIVLLRSCF